MRLDVTSSKSERRHHVKGKGGTALGGQRDWWSKKPLQGDWEVPGCLNGSQSKRQFDKK